MNCENITFCQLFIITINWLSFVHSDPDIRIFCVVLNDSITSNFIESSNFPEKYNQNDHVQWNISVQLKDQLEFESSRLKLTFEVFALENDCSKDFLQIYDGPTDVRTFCGYHVGKVVRLKSLNPKIIFKTDSKVELTGFRIRVELIKSTCVHQVNQTSGTIDVIPKSNQICIWEINGPKDHLIQLSFDRKFTIQSDKYCSNDYVSVSKTGDMKDDTLRFCGSKKPSNITSDNGEIIIKLVTSDAQSSCPPTGFTISYETVRREFKYKNGDDDDIIVKTRSCPSICGIENDKYLVKTRIVGGSSIWPPNRYPWLAALQMPWGEIFCGAALVNDMYLVTAGHCVYNMTPQKVKVVLGAHALNRVRDYLTLDVEKIILHPGYDRTSQRNDIALIKLRIPVTFSNKIRPVCLPIPSAEFFPDNLIIAGWGRTEEGGSMSLVPLQASVPQVPQSRCSRIFGSFMTSDNLCAGGIGSKDACQGDSGGPLISKSSTGRFMLAGVTSYGMGCGRNGVPGVYTKISHYVTWINIMSADGNLCQGISPNILASNEMPGDQPVNTGVCGVSGVGLRRGKRVVGGTPTGVLEFPWMAAIGFNGQIKGSGVLLTSKHVLTSAVNLKSFGAHPSNIKIIMGAIDVSSRSEPNKRIYGASKIYYHPNLGSAGHQFNYDFAIIELQPADATDFFNPICLPSYAEDIFEGDFMTIAGWGRRSTYDATGSRILLKATVELKSVAECSAAYLKNLRQPMICASGNSRDMCFGDEGGPLMMGKNGRQLLLGIKSWGSSVGCAITHKPSVFSDVRWSLPWISHVTGIKFV